MANEDIRRYSAEELKAMQERGDYVPTRPDAPEVELDEAFWQNARVVLPKKPHKTFTGLRLDDDVLEWFKAQGKGWQTRMNAILRSYMAAEQHKRHP